MKIILYPLIGILHISYSTFTLFRFLPEFAIVLAGLVASSLIGLVYFTPGALIISHIMKFKPSIELTRFLILSWLGTCILMIIGEIIRFSPLMRASTALYVILTISLTTTSIIRKIYQVFWEKADFLRHFLFLLSSS